jgi:holliday junction DNA helicase RuvA
MIAKLKGVVEENNLTSVIVDVLGVGYKVNCIIEDSKKLKVGSKVSVYTHLDVKETSMELYGFLEEEDKKTFELLLTVNGIGPKTALGILNSTSTKILIEGISSGDPKHLADISGLGKKQCEKLVMTLKEKVGVTEVDEKTKLGTSDAIEALVSLGYSPKESRDIISKIDKNLKTEQIIKEALKKLTR